MLAIAAALPIAVALVLFLARAKATTMALCSLATGLAVALLFFPAGPAAWLGAGMLFGPTVLEVMLILFGGVLLSRITTETGAMSAISGWLGRSASNPQAGTVLVVFGLVPFAESVTGFGIGVTVGVPLLLRLGHDVRSAALLSLLGLVAVPWGALGPGTLVAADLAGLGLQEVGVRSALLSVPVMLGSAVTCWLVLRRDAERPGRMLAHLVAAALLLNGGILAANLLMGTPPAGILGSLLVIVVHLAVFRSAGSLAPAGPRVLRALLPYGVLAAGLLLARLATSGLEPSLATRALASGGMWLLVACLVAQRVAPEPGAASRNAGGRLRAAYSSWVPVGVTTGAFTVLGAVLAVSGMGRALGEALASVGPAYLVLGPVAGGFAGFISGSNTGANSMLAATQAQAAAAMGSSVLQLVAVTNVAASMATMLAPSRIVLAYEMAVMDPGSGPDAGSPGEREVSAWVAPRIAALLAAVCLALGVLTWLVH
ncbi:L-lactate permease [Paeniglutamicibacter sp. R2-26]|uniref:L-lactate permease n=1 Tax=Paeniglutamicibacter sp. R2-26 TaxID=3144417 RepID=UPI003EE5EC8C